MDLEKFANLFLERIRQAGEKRELVYDPKHSSVKVAGDPGLGMLLGNVYTAYCSSPKEAQADVLRRSARGWFAHQKTIPDEFADAKYDLRPAVRSRLYFEADALRAELEHKKLSSAPYQLLGEDLAIGLVFDFPETMHTIRQDNLDGWGVTFPEALEVARDNLRALPYRNEADDGIYLMVTNDNYDASRLLLVDLVHQFHVKGDFVAMVPSRDTLIVTGSDDAKNLKRMAVLAKQALQQPMPISGLALRLDGEEWVSHIPDSSHPAYRDFRELRVQTYVRDYSEQKALLDKLHTTKQEGILVAPFRAGQDPTTGELLTFSVWSKGVPTLLPCTEGVAFTQKDREPVSVAWDYVMETVGHLMEPLDIYPPRWHVADFPTAQQMAAMEEKMEA